MLFPRGKLAMAKTELLKQDLELGLDGPKGCGYENCNRSVFEAIKRWETDYPTEVHCENREQKHVVFLPFLTLTSSSILEGQEQNL